MNLIEYDRRVKNTRLSPLSIEMGFYIMVGGYSPSIIVEWYGVSRQRLNKITRRIKNADMVNVKVRVPPDKVEAIKEAAKEMGDKL